jgi:hypothetical protein
MICVLPPHNFPPTLLTWQLFFFFLKKTLNEINGGKKSIISNNFPPFHGALSLSLSLFSACSFFDDFGGRLSPATSDFVGPSSSTQVSKSLSIGRFINHFPPFAVLSLTHSLSLEHTAGRTPLSCRRVRVLSISRCTLFSRRVHVSGSFGWLDLSPAK